jgi:predicted HTH domain antitoxin
MSAITVEVPERFLSMLGPDRERAPEELRLAAAMMYYEMGKLSAGAAAEFADIPVPVFYSRLSDFGICAFRQSAEELETELRHARGNG